MRETAPVCQRTFIHSSCGAASTDRKKRNPYKTHLQPGNPNRVFDDRRKNAIELLFWKASVKWHPSGFAIHTGVLVSKWNAAISETTSMTDGVNTKVDQECCFHLIVEFFSDGPTAVANGMEKEHFSWKQNDVKNQRSIKWLIREINCLSH